jgi:drug/metabolite transporter (DMT)-like permease
VTVNLVLSFTAILVAVMGVFVITEIPSSLQWAGMVVSLGGALVYFYPLRIANTEAAGLAAALVCVLANVAASLFGRKINRSRDISPLIVSLVSMGVGGPLLLAFGVAAQGMPHLTITHWGILFWLALLNTAFAFTLWNQTQRLLTAVESSVINNTMTVQVPILAVLFLGEQMSGKEIVGLVLAILGVALVQMRRARQSADNNPPAAG